MNKKNDQKKVQLSTDIAPNCIAKVSNDMFVYASDTDKCISMVSLEVADGTVRGNVSSFSKYTDGCTKVVSMCLNNNVLYISHQGNTGKVVGVKMTRLSADVFLLKGTADCLESCHIDAYDRGILFVDTASHQVKFKAPGGQVVIVVDTGKKGEFQ